MDWLQAMALALLQGLTEFLPISSSAHLILLPRLLGWPDQGLAYDVAVHLGSLAAVVWYFRRDISNLFNAWMRQTLYREQSIDGRLAWAVIIGTLPILLAGYLINGSAQDTLRNPLVIATTTLGFGLVLWLADRYALHARDESTLGWRNGLLIGIAQAIALIPGTSRSGITITAGLMLGLTRGAAARFSFLLSIPVILAASTLKLLDLSAEPVSVQWSFFLAGAIVSGITAYLCIHMFLRLVERIGLMPFVAYRVGLGLLLFYLFL